MIERLRRSALLLRCSGRMRDWTLRQRQKPTPWSNVDLATSNLELFDAAIPEP